MIARTSTLLRLLRVRRWAEKSERGSTSIQMVVLMPALFSVLFLGLQAALYYHASTVAGAAAQDGARVAASYDNSSGIAAGTTTALSALDQSHGSLQNYTVVGTAGAYGPTVTVTGNSLSLIPGLTLSVTRSASLPWEMPS
ncbi:MAG: pilus assembly protein [Propionibacterium sp.]|nr:pilus assembly protein [Propionibacterium sp.]